jgi:molybdopterin/thiamine biosynthesis adenylyltransferase
MTDAQIRRYARHILLPDVGGVGQDRLLARACTVAVGPERAAETCALVYLAAAGVGTIGLAGDLDAPITADEQRAQPVYALADVGTPRGPALVARLRALNPDVAVVPAAEVPAGAPALAITESPEWLGDEPAAAVAIATGAAAAHRLLAALYAP